MVQMVRVLEELPPDAGIPAEVSAPAGRFVQAACLRELRIRLRAALKGPGDVWFEIANWAGSCDSDSATALYLRV